MGSTQIPCPSFRDVKVSENDKCPYTMIVSWNWKENSRGEVAYKYRTRQSTQWNDDGAQRYLRGGISISDCSRQSIKKTYLWCVFLTQGIAAMELRMTVTSVTKPRDRMAGCMISIFLKLLTTLNISQAMPESAQPLWIPPRCWSADVIPRRNQRGGHCWVEAIFFWSILIDWANEGEATNLGEECVEE